MSYRLAGLLCALLSFSALSGHAKLWQSKELNFSINLPTEEGWTRVGVPNHLCKVAARSPNQKLVVSVIVFSQSGGLNPEALLDKFKKNWFKFDTSGETSETVVQVDGQSALCFKESGMTNGKTFYRADTVVIYGDNVYDISAFGTDSDPLSTITVSDIVASFKFLNKASASSPPYAAKGPAPVSSVGSSSTNKIPTAAPTGLPTLKTIKWIPSRPSAQLDTSFAFEGDKVRGYKVTKIHQDSVELLTPKGETLKLVLKPHEPGK
jgi:hypothetical protein